MELCPYCHQFSHEMLGKHTFQHLFCRFVHLSKQSFREKMWWNALLAGPTRKWTPQFHLSFLSQNEQEKNERKRQNNCKLFNCERKNQFTVVNKQFFFRANTKHETVPWQWRQTAMANNFALSVSSYFKSKNSGYYIIYLLTTSCDCAVIMLWVLGVPLPYISQTYRQFSSLFLFVTIWL